MRRALCRKPSASGGGPGTSCWSAIPVPRSRSGWRPDSRRCPMLQVCPQYLRPVCSGGTCDTVPQMSAWHEAPARAKPLLMGPGLCVKRNAYEGDIHGFAARVARDKLLEIERIWERHVHDFHEDRPIVEAHGHGADGGLCDGADPLEDRFRPGCGGCMCFERVLRRAVAPLGLAVSESGAGAYSRGRSAVG